MKDINFKIDNINFLCRSCAIVRNNDKVLFQKLKKDTFWALPGGKIALGETTKDAIRRELKEELDIEDINIKDTSSIAENFYIQNNTKIHQYIFTHEVVFNDPKYNDIEDTFDSKEEGKDTIFTWIKTSDLKKSLIKPDYIIDIILKDNDDVVFSTNIED